MTIMIERNSPLRVIDTSSSPQGSSGTSHDSSVSLVEDDFVVVDYTPLCSLPVVGKLRSSTSLDDEDTASTGSLSSDDNSSEGYYQDKRVSFTEDVVTDVWTRPFTPREQVSDLFYSTEETSRFRQEYRLERKLLNELSADPETLSLDEKDLAALVSPATTTSPQAYRISRVVVLHDNKLETFVDENADDVDDFFDNDSFWSGSITWY